MGVKVLAPGYYANQDIRTPVRIAVVVLVSTQLMNVALVPWLAHAGLALSIGLGALLNAGWLLTGLWRRRSWVPSAGWGLFLVRVVLATALMGAVLSWAGRQADWVALRSDPGLRVLWLGGVIALAGFAYFTTLRFAGLDLRALVRR